MTAVLRSMSRPTMGGQQPSLLCYGLGPTQRRRAAQEKATLLATGPSIVQLLVAAWAAWSCCSPVALTLKRGLALVLRR